jgi:predicted ATP-grasp superfamily ATP-dependent carboligase
MKIMPYKRFSKSCRTLRQAFGMRSLRVVHPDLTPRGRETVINWGSAKSKPMAVCKFLNPPDKVAVAVNKLETFKILKDAGVNVPEFSKSVEDAKTWIEKGYKVLVRSLLRSHSGQGIKVIDTVEDLPLYAPLYVRYYRKKHEFRVHVVNGEVVDYIEKKARQNKPMNFNPYIRSYDNGWVFCRDGITHIQEVKDEAIKAVKALGLDFGAVDVIFTKKDKPVVLEVNTAPAMSGTTINAYVSAFEQYMY